MGVIFEAKFKLSCPVSDRNAAQIFLSRDNITKYTPLELKDKISFVGWFLDDSQNGRVLVENNGSIHDSFTYEECNIFSEWIRGQNSDGLGEGFEQQDFAYNKKLETSANFDWKTNEYKLILSSV